MLRSRFTRSIKIAGAASIAMFAAGCVTVPPSESTRQLALADAAITDAVSAGSAQYAPADLNNAQRKRARAHEEAAQGDYAGAQDLAEEAEVDARLAAARARSTKSAAAASAVQASIRALDDEIARTPR